MRTATETWRALLRALLDDGREVAQASRGAAWRGRTSRELLAHQTVWQLASPVPLCPGRKLGYRFLAAEAAWVCSGDNRLATIEPFARQLRQLSGDGQRLSGAYGPPFVDQLPYVVRALEADPATRQAVATLWRQRPMADPDTPCTVALQWLLREGALHCVATMRSSDAWFGVVYDVHAFAMMSAVVSLSLSTRPPLGHLYLTAGSQHLYKLDWPAAEACVARSDEALTLAPLDLAPYATADQLIEHLRWVANHDGRFASAPRGAKAGTWLEEVTVP